MPSNSSMVFTSCIDIVFYRIWKLFKLSWNDRNHIVLGRRKPSQGDWGVRNTAIKRLQELCLGVVEATRERLGLVEELGTIAEQVTLINDGEAVVAVIVQNLSALENLPVDGAKWVDLFAREMIGDTRVDDAKARAFRLLEVLEKSISNYAAEEAAQSFHKENILLKE
ncbi:hypothetical protein CRYUN_Cryun14cG0085900 [Craigia yunnanensis]